MIPFKLFHPQDFKAFAGRSMDVLLGVLDSLEVGKHQLVDPSIRPESLRFEPPGSRRIHGLHGSM